MKVEDSTGEEDYKKIHLAVGLGLGEWKLLEQLPHQINSIILLINQMK